MSRIVYNLTDTDYAEIEFEPGLTNTLSENKKNDLHSYPVPSQLITQRFADPIRQKFYNMRNLAADNPFARYDAAVFYRQAKFMEGFSDDYRGNEQFFMYYPSYQHMGYEQLRTYFTWRSKIRSGQKPPAASSYIFLYIYELLSNVGVNNPADGLDKLTAVWNAYREYEPVLDKYLPGWLKDYHIYYQLPHSFADFVQKHNLQAYYPDQFLFETGADNSLMLWNSISSYDITKSRFYNAGNEALCRDCFCAVLGGVRELCANRNIHTADLPVYSFCIGASWFPFQRALFYHWEKQPDRVVEMPGGELYFCKGNQWTANISIQDSNRKDFAGYLIKKTEECLRQAVKYKFKITADRNMVRQSFHKLRALGIPLPELDNAIGQAISDFHRGMTRIAVSVDNGNLARIRKEAQGTQDKLIVPEDDIRVSDLPVNPVKEPTDQVSDAWAALKDSLGAIERKALAMALRGDAGIKTFADENGIMLEVLVEGINDKSVDCVRDSILEMDDSVSVYDEYREKITELVG